MRSTHASSACELMTTYAVFPVDRVTATTSVYANPVSPRFPLVLGVTSSLAPPSFFPTWNQLQKCFGSGLSHSYSSVYRSSRTTSYRRPFTSPRVKPTHVQLLVYAEKGSAAGKLHSSGTAGQESVIVFTLTSYPIIANDIGITVTWSLPAGQVLITTRLHQGENGDAGSHYRVIKKPQSHRMKHGLYAHYSRRIAVSRRRERH